MPNGKKDSEREDDFYIDFLESEMDSENVRTCPHCGQIIEEVGE